MTIEDLYKQCVRNGTEQNILAEQNEIVFGYNDGLFKIVYNISLQWRKFEEEIPEIDERIIVFEQGYGFYIGSFKGLTQDQTTVINIFHYGEHYIEKYKGYWMRLPAPPDLGI